MEKLFWDFTVNPRKKTLSQNKIENSANIFNIGTV